MFPVFFLFCVFFPCFRFLLRVRFLLFFSHRVRFLLFRFLFFFLLYFPRVYWISVCFLKHDFSPSFDISPIFLLSFVICFFMFLCTANSYRMFKCRINFELLLSKRQREVKLKTMISRRRDLPRLIYS